jgi:hypothetical protein
MRGENKYFPYEAENILKCGFGIEEMMSSPKHVFDVPGRLDERKPSISQKMSVLGFIWKIAVWQRVSNMAGSYLDPMGLKTLNNSWPVVGEVEPLHAGLQQEFEPLSKVLMLPNQAFLRP